MDIDYEELYKWIDQQPITRQKRNISRDFSDAIPLVEILKLHYPKLVEIHNYSPQNSRSRKLINWYTLNKRVLPKLGLRISNATIDDLVESKPGVIESVLMKLKAKIEAKGKESDGNSDCIVLEGLSSNSTGSVIPVKLKSGTKFSQQKMVPSEVFDRMEKDLAEKDEEIAVLNNKVSHLENMIAIKDERIKDLTQQLNTIANSSSNVVAENMRSAKFFNGVY